jgi:hypothetical protein
MKKSLFEGLNVGELDGIKAGFTFALQKNLPRGYILYEKNDKDEIQKRHDYHVPVYERKEDVWQCQEHEGHFVELEA